MTIKKGLFIAFAAIIILVPVYVAISSQNVLDNGKLYKFRPMAYDPFDPFRGKFLRVNYQTNGIPTDFDFKERETAYVSIGVDKEGFAFFEEAFKSPPKTGDYLQTKVRNSRVNRDAIQAIQSEGTINIKTIDTRNRLQIDIPDNMNKYFINEDDAKPAEEVMFSERNNIYIGVRILDGEARLDNIFVHDKPILEYIKSNKKK